MFDIKIKLCGFKTKETVDLAAEEGADFIGLVFESLSPRFVNSKTAADITASLPKEVKKVAVLIDPDNIAIEEVLQNFQPDFWQLHGIQTPERIAQIKNLYHIPVIKGFALNNVNDLATVKDYEEVADLFLFDNKTSGSGQSFDWKILKNLKTGKDWFLSGGLNVDNIEQALQMTGAKMIDLSSGIEEVRGIKSPRLIKEFMEKARELGIELLEIRGKIII